jgi:ATP-dependent Clp protease ATP-binding subunit ClpC
LRRAIQRLIEDPLADFVIRTQAPSGSTVFVDVEQPPPVEDGKKKAKPGVTLSVIEPAPKPTPVGVGAEGGGSGEEGEAGEPQADPPAGDATPSEGE